MPTYGDVEMIKERSGIAASDLSNISDSTDLDDLIQSLNERASNAIERWCNRGFEHHTGETAVLDGNGKRDKDGHGRIRVDGWPIDNISDIRIDGDSLDSSDYRIVTLDGQPDTNVGVIQRKNSPFPEGWGNVEVDYDWGYQNTPPAVQAVAEDLVIDELRTTKGDDRGLGAQSVSMDGYSVTYFESSVERSERHKDRLQPFRRLSLGVS
jgi:hypothetical protein